MAANKNGRKWAVWLNGIAAGALLTLSAGIGLYLISEPRSAQEFCLAYETGEGDARYAVAIAEKPRKREVGLMFREDLVPGEGMLFLFDEPAPRSFWMKNTPLPLDIIFLTKEMRVINIERGEPFSREPIESDADAEMVLELPAGEARRLEMTVGTQVGPFRPLPEPVCRD